MRVSYLRTIRAGARGNFCGALLPLEDLGLGVARLVDLPFADAEHAVQTLPLGRGGLDADRVAPRGTHALAGRFADAVAGPAQRVALAAHGHAVALAAEGAR